MPRKTFSANSFAQRVFARVCVPSNSGSTDRNRLDPHTLEHFAVGILPDDRRIIADRSG